MARRAKQCLIVLGLLGLPAACGSNARYETNQRTMDREIAASNSTGR